MRSRGFSLLEVMIALAIFGLMIVGVLSAQAGVAATNKKSADIGQAIELARCRMTEAEEKLTRDGYPDMDDLETDAPCCEGVDMRVFSCEKRIEKVKLPDPPSAGGDGGAGGGLLSLGGLGGPGGPGGAPSGGAPGGDAPFNAQLDLDGGLNSIASQLSPQAGGKGAGGMLNMVMGFVYPTMKPVLEASIRRITIVVHWKEGPNPQHFELVQYVTDPQRSAFGGGLGLGDGGAPPSGGPLGGGVGGGATGGSTFGGGARDGLPIGTAH